MSASPACCRNRSRGRLLFFVFYVHSYADPSSLKMFLQALSLQAQMFARQMDEYIFEGVFSQFEFNDFYMVG